MSQFTRPSDWLRQLFTPSRFGWNPPSSVSPDVSLVQPYDGGGYPTSPIGQYIIEPTNTPAAAGNMNAVQIVGPEQICRVLSVSCRATAGVLPRVFFFVRDSALTLSAVSISETITMPALNETQGFRLDCPIIPPGHNLGMNWVGGDVLTALTAICLVSVAPLGSVFYT